ncbi:HvnC protein [Pseudescherichia vulneris]|uniref:HvnC protein n=1 Tax=Pseudescherichia vulneris TaxID=566 RepID=UPI0028AE289C|nr:HvnC protein [Pseudescherichia vulneris]
MKYTLLSGMIAAALVFTTPFVAAQDIKQAKTDYFKTHSLRIDRYSGAETAKYLNEDYASKVENCGGSSTPAFLCSGVLFRGTAAFSTSFHSWDPSPSSQTSGGVSFSYLRADAKFSKLAYSYNNGFIFYPYFYAPDNAGIDTNIDVLCSFPIDAASNSRSDKGCGAHSSYPNDSGPCQDQDIFTAEEWYAHYVKGNRNHAYQCGFTVEDGSVYNIADGFYQTILSMATIASESINEQNELRLATWAQGKQDSLPIEAFFYIKGNTSGLSSAQKNQQDFYNSTTDHIWVPVIQMTLPANASSDAAFVYQTSDQLVPEPASQK